MSDASEQNTLSYAATSGMERTLVPPSLERAVRLLSIGLRAEMRTHLGLEELEAYATGSLPQEDRERVADHIALCEECSALLQFGVLQQPAPPASPEAEASASWLDQDWERLLSRLETNDDTLWKPLIEVLDGGALEAADLLDLALSVARALVDLHRRGRVVHDLRAETVLVGPDRQIRFRDPGAVPMSNSGGKGSNLSADDVLADLYRAASPEQFAGEDLDASSNLFSFGVLLYEMTTTVSPFRASTPMDTASRILALDPLAPRDLNPEIAPELSALILRLLGKSREDRPHTAEAVVGVLSAILGRDSPAGREALGGTSAADAEIEALYDEITALTLARKETDREGSPNDDSEARLRRAVARLRELQAQEAEDFRQEFDARLTMPLEAGKAILNRSQTLIKKLEGLTSNHPTSG